MAGARTYSGAQNARRRRIRGDRAFRRLVKRVPAAVREEMVKALDQGGDAILAMQRADATVSNRVRAALSKRVLRGSLRLRVGLVGRPINKRLWFARIIEKGRKAQVARVRRGSRAGKGFAVNVRGMAARPFIYSARANQARRDLGGALNRYWERVLAKASQGVTDD